jgi:hypothetical protein
MKILTKNKIVESFHFPISEALIFSILVWSAWGLAEAFYWHGLSGMLDRSAASPDSYIYLEAFLMYVGIAAFLATLIYIGMRIILSLFHLHNTVTFRAYTLCAILGVFFAAALFFTIDHFAWESSLGTNTRYIAAFLLVGFALFITILLYRYASGAEFRIRRSGTMMLSILVISLVLSFVHFPLFANESEILSADPKIQGYQKLMGYYYIAPLLK